jgi:hypothetical protein
MLGLGFVAYIRVLGLDVVYLIGNAKDEHESLEKTIKNLWNNPEHSQSFGKIPVGHSNS